MSALGTQIDVSHGVPTPVGQMVAVHARLVLVDGRRLSFDIEAHGEVELTSRGGHQRFIVQHAALDDQFARKAAAAANG